MPASMGKRDSTIWQKACRVRTFNPPGVSSAPANSRRALRRSLWASPPICAMIARAVLVVGQHRPFAQLPEQAALHLRRRRLGEGEAENALGLACRAASATAPRDWPGYRSCPRRHWPPPRRKFRDRRRWRKDRASYCLPPDARPFAHPRQMVVIAHAVGAVRAHPRHVRRSLDCRTSRCASASQRPRPPAPARRHSRPDMHGLPAFLPSASER